MALNCLCSSRGRQKPFREKLFVSMYQPVPTAPQRNTGGLWSSHQSRTIPGKYSEIFTATVKINHWTIWTKYVCLNLDRMQQQCVSKQDWNTWIKKIMTKTKLFHMWSCHVFEAVVGEMCSVFCPDDTAAPKNVKSKIVFLVCQVF